VDVLALVLELEERLRVDVVGWRETWLWSVAGQILAIINPALIGTPVFACEVVTLAIMIEMISVHCH